MSEIHTDALHRILENTPDGRRLFELLSGACQGAIVIDSRCKVAWISDAYRQLLSVSPDAAVLGRPVEELLPTSQLPRVVRSGKPMFADLMQLNERWCLVNRMPLRDEQGEVIGAIGLVFYQELDSLQPLFDKFARLRQQLESHNLIRSSKYALDDLIGESEVLKQLRRQALRAAQLDTTLLLLGETGTGKELLAQGIHNASPRCQGPFVGINMAALPESLVEAELFGAAPGAYTGIDKRGRQGKVQLANGGTLFLDEIAEMPLTMQAKLLRVLQEREVEALGSNRLEKVDVRVIAATAVDLKERVARKEFRADLYYRLNVLPIRLPPLRDRKEDISLISHHLLNRIQQQAQLPSLALSEQALHWLQQYPWPGNVRELHNRLERACVMAEGERIEPVDLGAYDDLPAQPLGQTPAGQSSLAESRWQAECRTLQQAIDSCAGNKSRAARQLGISRATLYERLKRYQLS
ncbi:sigma-54 interaction domain-containing protein [Marinobacterium arenosum]|uniref:sigma-54 interaction domain-containing protein n=1 Tax=Marinobacterium arenosum TaxID=2862496 RepID=UPI001C9411FA|nr:sigma 54-interacting transcriptional regulator [Marinobacterium arenosum]MBY4677464.1 sigma 54-interacting transcriptional regulator [Marinobacterium arenosum]